MSASRTENSLKNTVSAAAAQLVSAGMAFISRTVFIHTLGKAWLGYSGLFSNILSLLSLAELGAGTAVLHALYRPAAEKDRKKMAALVNLYRTICLRTGLVIFAAGCCLLPFLDSLISGMKPVPELRQIYLLYLLQAAADYFFASRKTLLTACQENYVISAVSMAVSVVQNLLQAGFLLAGGSFFLYLEIQLACTLLGNVALSACAGRKHRYLKTFRTEKADMADRRGLRKDVRAVFVSRLSSAAVSSTDNLLISAFVSTAVLGVFSNYMLFVSLLRNLLSRIFDALSGSVGNLVTAEKGPRVCTVFARIWFLNFWLAAFPCASMFVLANPFLELWAGPGYLLGMDVVFLICLNLFMRLIRNTFLVFHDACGHFAELRLKSIAEAVLNLLLSLLFLLPLRLGIRGVLLGTFCSNLFTNFWYEPWLLYRKLGMPFSGYFRDFAGFLSVLFLAGGAAWFLCGLPVFGGGWGSFFLRAAICCLTVNLTILLFYGRTESFRYFIRLAGKALKKRKILKNRKTV